MSRGSRDACGRTRVSIGDRPTAVVVLTRDGKALLEAHQEAREDGRQQRYHVGLVKPRELSHDAQLYRLYQAKPLGLKGTAGGVVRVVLDYELKQAYQTFLNRPDRPTTGSESPISGRLRKPRTCR